MIICWSSTVHIFFSSYFAFRIVESRCQEYRTQLTEAENLAMQYNGKLAALRKSSQSTQQQLEDTEKQRAKYVVGAGGKEIELFMQRNICYQLLLSTLKIIWIKYGWHTIIVLVSKSRNIVRHYRLDLTYVNTTCFCKSCQNEKKYISYWGISIRFL